jgi:hypothetical protein
MRHPNGDIEWPEDEYGNAMYPGFDDFFDWEPRKITMPNPVRETLTEVFWDVAERIDDARLLRLKLQAAEAQLTLIRELAYTTRQAENAIMEAIGRSQAIPELPLEAAIDQVVRYALRGHPLPV